MGVEGCGSSRGETEPMTESPCSACEELRKERDELRERLAERHFCDFCEPDGNCEDCDEEREQIRAESALRGGRPVTEQVREALGEKGAP